MRRFKKPKYIPVHSYEGSHVKLRERYSTEEQAQELLIKLRWGYQGVTCIKCGSKDIYEVGPPLRFVCKPRRHKFSITSGTYLNHTKVPLVKWIWVAYSAAEFTYGITAQQIAHNEELKDDTVDKMLRAIRNAMGAMVRRGPRLDGIVEVDESEVGGRGYGHPKRRNKGKITVYGIVQHGGGNTYLEVGKGHSQGRLVDFIRRHTDPKKLKGIYTDGHKAYQGIEKIFGVPHEFVNHSKGEYVRGDVYTNSIESVWSETDRTIDTYEHVSRKYMQLYLNEIAWRHNYKNSDCKNEELWIELLSKPRQHRGRRT